ncbi:NADPH:quinone oxidoreductase family protein [Allopusillimonas soli]|uniref:NADPH:quinone oxidoreductase family protein n=1 Tax=Allopusillimonas soli TaxID=659016 RepID=A0A853FBN2_9BURK|nr:NADPH:quinone oxidoreductase family protein [Allopusillimonas soli]NYT35476.1 NADPH:quinone oxidoreductase family protein [Allopusillimonas soli]TEA75888.1 NADPH:quinone oxidoreductase family protein [Allopusillimonas soli]
MRALQCDRFGPARQVALRACAEPGQPGPHDVLIEVVYASVSHAVGLMVEGRYQTRPPLPFTPGTEAVGRVAAVGERVTRFNPGDPVVAIARWGCFAERILVAEHTVYPVPDGLPLLHALPLPISYGTAYTGLLWRCGLQPGEAVLVLGAGSGVGLAAVELAAQMGADVIACASTEAKRDTALAHGALAAFEPGPGLANAVKDLTQGRGADLVVDPVGGALFGTAVRAAAHGGRLLSVGFASGDLPDVKPNLLLVKNLTLHGFFYGRYIGWTPADERVTHAPALQRAMATMMRWARDGRIQPRIQQVFPMDGLADALQALHGRQVVGKLALAINNKEEIS